MSAGKLFLVLAGLWLVLPAGLFALYNLDTARGLIWLLLHQLYYAPFGTWLEEPFFTPDTDVGYWARPMGRAVAAACYAAILLAGRAVVRKVTRKRVG